MIGLAAVVPQPPLLIPELVGGAAGETHGLRAACETAVHALSAAGARHWVAVGVDESGPRRVLSSARGTFAGYGVDVPVSLAPHAVPNTVDVASTVPIETNVTSTAFGEQPDALPLALLVAGWLRSRAGAPTTVMGEVLHPMTSPAASATRGRELADELAASEEPIGLLVLGDGASTHPAPGAGRVDERAGPFDEAVRAALAQADAEALLAMDEQLAAQLGATGRPAWQVLAGVVQRTGVPWRADLLYSAAPYGVAYHVAVWRPSR